MAHAPTIEETQSPGLLAQYIREDWRKPYFGAVPYIDAMRTMDSFDQDYIYDSGKSIGLYFLANANTWRGDVARRVKKRIKELCK